MSEQKQARSSAVVAKAGLWFTVCNVLFRGLAFITTPIFARLLTKAELGSFSNMASWASIIGVLTSFDLAQSIIRSKLEHEDDIDSYIWSILSFSTLWTLLCYGVVCLFPTFFTSLFEMDMRCIHIMFISFLCAPAYSMLATKHRAFYKYKTYVALTGLYVVASLALSVVLVLTMQDKLMGRVIGNYAPHIVIGGIIFVHLAIKGKRIKTEYWKYACVICIPLVPHVLSLHLLSASDRIIITRTSGSEYTAIYSIAYSAYHIATLIFDSMNKAFAPWLLESLHHENYKAIQKTSKVYIGVFVVLVVGVLLLAPEVIWILGGKQYAGAVYCIPPLIASCVIQLIYRMYVNIEFYKKKTVGVAVATIIAAGVNILLNLILIPLNIEHSHIIASYTTLAGYMLLFGLHYYMVRRMKLDHVYDIRYILKILLVVFVLAGITIALYGWSPIIRYVLVVIYGAAVLYVGYRNKETILGLFRNKKKAKA